MSSPPITIQVDQRIQVMAAVLSMTTWPFQEQDQKPHDVHTHAKATRGHLKALEEHPAVLAFQEALEIGSSLDEIFAFSANLSWPELQVTEKMLPEWTPPELAGQLRDFVEKGKLLDLWERDTALWEAAQKEAKQALSKGEPQKFLSRFFWPLAGKLVFQPNLAFPTDRAIGFRRGEEIVCVCPPRISWGHNPPWPYDDDPAATTADAMNAFARVLLREYLEMYPKETEAAKKSKLPIPNTFRAKFPDWFDQFSVLFTNGLTTIYLQQTFGKAKSDAFMMMVQKAHGFKVMPSVVEVLERYLTGREEGKFEAFADYMPIFSKTLNAAETMRKL